MKRERFGAKFALATVLALVAVLLLMPAAQAQTGGANLVGKVQDKSGKPLPGVTITATQKDTGLTSDEWLESQESTFAPILASGRFPVLSGITMHPDFEFDPDTLFELGLKLMLDGLAVLLQRSPAS